MKRGQFDRPEEGRRCAKCDRILPLKAFRKGYGTSDGLSSWCRECHIAATRDWRAKNRRRVNAGKRDAYGADRDAINARRRELYAGRRRNIARETT